MEQYNLPVQYNEEQRKQYEKWGRKRARIDAPIVDSLIIVIYFLFIKFLIFIQTDIRHASLKDFRFWIIFLFVLFLFYNFRVAVMLTTTILVPINYIIDMILNKPADPLTIFVLPKNDGAEYAIKRKSKDIKNGFMSWDEWELALDMGANSIKINDDEYKIGSNSQEFIYNVSDKNKKVRFEVPKEDLKEIKDIQKLKENLKSYRASVEEKEKEEAWERKQK